MTTPASSTPLSHNLLLLTGYSDIGPLVIRDFGDMRRRIDWMLTSLDETLAAAAAIKPLIESSGHGDDCAACVYLRNVALRLDNDFGLYAIHLEGTRRLWAGITKVDSINAAKTSHFLSLALTTRAILDSSFRSSVLFWKHDFRQFNKQLAESLESLRKLKWSTMGGHLRAPALIAALDEFAGMSNRLKQDSANYSDPAPTFKGKVELFRQGDTVGLGDFFDECDAFYSALSDMVHGGPASMMSAVPPGGQIILASGELRFIASAHHLAELIGVTLTLAHKLLVTLYLPLLTSTLGGVEGAMAPMTKAREVHDALLAKRSTLSF